MGKTIEKQKHEIMLENQIKVSFQIGRAHV